MSSADASYIFTEYLLDATSAIINVARRVESLSDKISPEDAEIASAILFGTPKPSAGDIASLINHRRRQMSKSDLSSYILDSVSVTKFGQGYHNNRAERDMKEILNYIWRMPIPGKDSMYRRNNSWRGFGVSLNRMCDRNMVNIGLSVNGEPILDKEKYAPPRPGIVNIQNNVFNEIDVRTKLLDIFKLLNIKNDDIDSLIRITRLKVIDIAKVWAESVETQLQSNSDTTTTTTSITEKYMSDAKEGVHYLGDLVRDTLFKPTSQLTQVQDVDDMQTNMKKYIFLINVNALERMVSALLFYSCFEVLDSPQETIALEGGVRKKKIIVKRDINNIFFCLCFFFQNFSTSYVDALIGTSDLVNHKSHLERIVRNLLSGYSFDSDDPWTSFNHVLDKRREIINRNQGLRKDMLDCRVNLSSSMHVVVSDALGSVRRLNNSLENFLSDLRDQNQILKSYYNACRNQQT